MPDFVIGYEQDTFGPYLAKVLACHFRSFRSEYYPEGTPAPKINAGYEEIEGKHVLVVRRASQISDRHDVCRHLVNYPRVARSLRDSDTFNASTVDILHPYFLLGKQDHNPRTDCNPRVRTMDAGKDIGYKYEAGLFRGCNKLLTFHPHFNREPGEEVIEGVRVFRLDLIPAMVEHAKDTGLDIDCLVVSPDFAGCKDGANGYVMAKSFAEHADLEFGCIEAERQDEHRKIAKEYDAKGRDVLIIDDSTMTFGTISSAARAIRNARNIDVYVVHAMLTRDAYEKAQQMLRSGQIRSFVTTDAVKSDFAQISVAQAVAEYYRNLALE